MHFGKKNQLIKRKKKTKSIGLTFQILNRVMRYGQPNKSKFIVEGIMI
jgi:hypothetical protein